MRRRYKSRKPAPPPPSTAWTRATIGCPWCLTRGMDCCRCSGTGVVRYQDGMLRNAWEVRGCDCWTCIRLRARREAIWAAADLAEAAWAAAATARRRVGLAGKVAAVRLTHPAPWRQRETESED